MRDDVSLRRVIIVAGLGAVALGLATLGYYRSLSRSILMDAPIPVLVVPADEAALATATAAIRAAQGARATVTLDEPAANRALFAEWSEDERRRLRLTLDPPFARLAVAERDDGRWLNATLVVSPVVAPGGLGFRVLSGEVGAISISQTRGEWVRLKIERRLAHELAKNPRTRGLFGGLEDVRVEPRGLVLRFGPRPADPGD